MHVKTRLNEASVDLENMELKSQIVWIVPPLTCKYAIFRVRKCPHIML